MHSHARAMCVCVCARAFVRACVLMLSLCPCAQCRRSTLPLPSSPLCTYRWGSARLFSTKAKPWRNGCALRTCWWTWTRPPTWFMPSSSSLRKFLRCTHERRVGLLEPKAEVAAARALRESLLPSRLSGAGVCMRTCVLLHVYRVLYIHLHALVSVPSALLQVAILCRPLLLRPCTLNPQRRVVCSVTDSTRRAAPAF